MAHDKYIMRAYQFTEDIGQQLDTWNKQATQAIHGVANQVGDMFSKESQQRLRTLANQLLPQIKNNFIKQIQQQVERKRSSAEQLQNLHKLFALVTITYQTNIDHKSHALDYTINLDPWQLKTLDPAAVAWVLAHELGHVLHVQWYRTHSQDIKRDPQAGEKFADNIATWSVKQLGYNKAEVFKRMNDPEYYASSNQPQAVSPGSHPTVYQRRQQAQQQGFDLTRAPLADPSQNTA